MEHPFAPDLSEKSIEELQNDLNGLYSKLNFAHRSGNTALIHQLYMMIESYRAEYSRKMDEMFTKQNINADIKID